VDIDVRLRHPCQDLRVHGAELTPSKVKKAGSTMRRYLRSDERVTDTDAFEAIEVIRAFRALHQKPLVTANNGLRSMVRTCGYEVKVTQRLKRMLTILDKLIREPTLPLHRMQDIGGVRAVLASIEEVRRVEARIKRNRELVGYYDYVKEPRSSGYRGVHLIVEYGGRQIEIQLRTHIMHEWAITVERLSSRLGTNLKGDGEHAVQALMSAISMAMALEETGDIVDSSLLSHLDELRSSAAPYLGRG
jgi:putative GTP pyrophosphokinase